METLKKEPTKKDKIFIAFIIIAIAFCVKLGFWQINRMHWKADLIQKVEDGKTMPPQVLNIADFDEKRDLFKRVTAQGEFINTQELYLGGKYLTEERDGKEIGVHIITPFRLKSGEVVFVNRGWMPQDKREKMNHTESVVDNEITLEAMVRESKGTPPWYMPANMPAKNIWFWIDIPAMKKFLEKQGIQNVQPILLQQTNLTVKSGDFPKLLPTDIKFYNEHLTYVYTWFGIALGLAVMLVFWIKRKK